MIAHYMAQWSAGMLAIARAHGGGEAGQWWHRHTAVDSGAQGRDSDTAPGCGCGKGCVQMVARVCWGSTR